MLKEGCWYGTTGPLRDILGYYQIEPDSITMPSFGARGVSFPAVIVGVARCDGRAGPCRIPGSIDGRLDQSRRLVNGILGYCADNPGVAVVTSGPGDRDASKVLSRYYNQALQRPFVSTEELDSSLSCIINGVNRLKGV